MLGSVRGVVSNDHSYRDKANPRVPTLFRVRKATRFGRTIARSERPGVVEEPGMCRSSLDGNREIPRLASCGAPLGPASGRRGAVADDERTWEVRLRNSSWEADGNASQQSTRRAQDRESVSQALERIRQVARQRKKERFTSLFHHISVELLRVAFFALKRDAAPGVDGLTWQDYEADLDRKIEDLHARVHRGAYRALPSRRHYIPKADGQQRPLAIATHRA